MNKYCIDNAEKEWKEWWNLAKYLIVIHNNGYITTNGKVMQKTDYRRNWLDIDRCYQGPISYRKADCCE